MPSLSKAQLDEFLTDQPHIMKLATLTPEGWPYVNPLWYEYDGEVFHVAGRGKARWVAHIKNDPRVSVCIDTYDAPYTRVLMEARAEIVDDNWQVPSSDKAIRYLGDEAGRKYFGETGHIPRNLVRITPIETTSWSGGGWHPRYRA